MTGLSVDDERKFNYRKSMHLVLQHIWRIPVHKQAVKVSYMPLLCKYLPLYFSTWSWIQFFSHFLIVNTFWSERCFIYQRRCKYVMKLTFHLTSNSAKFPILFCSLSITVLFWIWKSHLLISETPLFIHPRTPFISSLTSEVSFDIF